MKIIFFVTNRTPWVNINKIDRKNGDSDAISFEDIAPSNIIIFNNQLYAFLADPLNIYKNKVFVKSRFSIDVYNADLFEFINYLRLDKINEFNTYSPNILIHQCRFLIREYYGFIETKFIQAQLIFARRHIYQKFYTKF